MALKKLGHVVLKVRDLDRSEAFYTSVLGLAVTGRLPGRMVFFAVPGNTDSHDLGLWKAGPDAAPQVIEAGRAVPRRVAGRARGGPPGVPRLARGPRDSGAIDHGPRREPLRVLRGSRTGNMLEVTYEKPREAWPPGLNPFAGREPLRFQAAPR